MLGDVGEPNPIRPIGSELTLHKIIVGCRVGAMPALAAVTDNGNIGCSHQPCHAFTTDAKPQAQTQLRVDPGSPISAP